MLLVLLLKVWVLKEKERLNEKEHQFWCFWFHWLMWRRGWIGVGGAELDLSFRIFYYIVCFFLSCRIRSLSFRWCVYQNLFIICLNVWLILWRSHCFINFIMAHFSLPYKRDISTKFWPNLKNQMSFEIYSKKSF